MNEVNNTIEEIKKLINEKLGNDFALKEIKFWYNGVEYSTTSEISYKF